jgi:hypothetical protein
MLYVCVQLDWTFFPLGTGQGRWTGRDGFVQGFDTNL